MPRRRARSSAASAAAHRGQYPGNTSETFKTDHDYSDLRGEQPGIPEESALRGVQGLHGETAATASTAVAAMGAVGRGGSDGNDADAFSAMYAAAYFASHLLPPVFLLLFSLSRRARQHLSRFPLHHVGEFIVVAMWPFVVFNAAQYVRCASLDAGEGDGAAADGLPLLTDVLHNGNENEVVAKRLLRAVKKVALHLTGATENGECVADLHMTTSPGCVITRDEAVLPLATYLALAVIMSFTAGYALAHPASEAETGQSWPPSTTESAGWVDSRSVKRGLAMVIPSDAPIGHRGDRLRVRPWAICSWFVLSRVAVLFHTVYALLARYHCGMPILPSSVDVGEAWSGSAWWLQALLRWSVVGSAVATHVLAGHLVFVYIECVSLFELRARMIRRFNALTSAGLAQLPGTSASKQPAPQLPDVFHLTSLAGLRAWMALRHQVMLYAPVRSASRAQRLPAACHNSRCPLTPLRPAVHVVELFASVGSGLCILLATGIFVSMLFRDDTGTRWVPTSPRAFVGVILVSVALVRLFRRVNAVGLKLQAQVRLLGVKAALLVQNTDTAPNTGALVTALQATQGCFAADEQPALFGISTEQLAGWVTGTAIMIAGSQSFG